MVSTYLDNRCNYSIPLLKNRIYVYDESVLTLIDVDNGLDSASTTSTPTLLTGFSISYSEETSLDERYKFVKQLQISMNDKIDIDSVFDGKYYVVVEDYDGNLYLTNPDYQYKYTYTYNLSYGINQTDITLQTSSNFPLLKIDLTPPIYTQCKSYRFTDIKSLELIEKAYASFSTDDSILYTTDNLKKVDFLKNSLSFQEQYDGTKVTSTLKFKMPLKSALVSWDYDLLEFKDNIYTAVITTNDDYKILTGIYTGLQPSYTIAASMSDTNTYEITMVESSNNGSVAVELTNDELLGLSWEYIRILGENNAYYCNMSHGCGIAEIIVMAEVDAFGNQTGRYKVEEDIYNGLYNQTDPDIDYSWYDDNFGWLRQYNVIGSFEDDYPNGWFPTNECACFRPHPSVGCELTTDMPFDIEFEGSGSTSYTFQADCNWSISEVPSGITISPTSGVADSAYTISIANSSTDLRQVQFKLTCCTAIYRYSINVVEAAPCIEETSKQITCEGQTVQFKIKDGCEFVITSLPTGLLANVSNNILYVNVPANGGQSSKTYYINGTCCGNAVTLQISQNPPFTVWLADGYVCSAGTKYVKETLWTGTTAYDIVKTAEYRLGEEIEENSPDCRSIETYSGIGYTCIDGDKYELLRRYLSWDDGETWVEQDEVKLGEFIEADSSFCEQETQYKWVLTDEWACDEYEPPSSRLPSGYTEVEYVENQSQAYVNTGFKPNQDTRILCSMKCVTSTGGGIHVGAGGWDKADGMCFDYENGITGTLHISWGTKTTWSVYSSVRGDYNIHTYDWNKNEFYRDETLVGSVTYTNFQCADNLGIFYSIQNGSPWGQFYGRLYMMQIYDNGTLVRDYVPCKRDSDSKAGLYDLVNNTFTSSANAYNLVAGSEV